MIDQHRYYAIIEAGYYARLEIECPYSTDDTARPCWARGEDGLPLPAPQPCNYREWLEACDVEDVLHGSTRLRVHAQTIFTNGGFELHLLEAGECPGSRRTAPIEKAGGYWNCPECGRRVSVTMSRGTVRVHQKPRGRNLTQEANAAPGPAHP